LYFEGLSTIYPQDKKLRRSRIDIKSIVIALIIINVVIYFVSQFRYFSIPESFLNNLSLKGKDHTIGAINIYGLFMTLFSLFPAMIRLNGWLWQFFTYMFLHGGLLHLFFNMYALLLFGRPLEDRWGWKEFLSFYLVTGTCAGIVTFFWNLVSNPFIPTVGASGAIFGVILAFGLEFPDAVLLLFFMIPMKAKYAALIFGGINLIMLVTGARTGVGHFTHLAGLFFGYIYFLVRIRGRQGRGKFKIRPRALNVAPKKKKVALSKKQERITQKAIQVKNKLEKGGSLEPSEEALLAFLRKAYDKSGNKMCGPDEFETGLPECMNCEDYYACLYRWVIMVL
jgi:membrane associated rhomboid family serine protease